MHTRVYMSIYIISMYFIYDNVLDQFVPGVPVNVILDVPVESASISDGVDALNVGACVFFMLIALLMCPFPQSLSTVIAPISDTDVISLTVI